MGISVFRLCLLLIGVTLILQASEIIGLLHQIMEGFSI
jgi:hypothetical protein